MQLCLPQVDSVGGHGRRQKRDPCVPAGVDRLLPRHADGLGAEHSAHRGPDRLGVIGVGAAVEQNGRDLQGIGRAQDGAEIARVLDAVEQQRAGHQGRRRSLRQAAEENGPLRRVHQGDGLHHVLRHADDAGLLRKFT